MLRGDSDTVGGVVVPCTACHTIRPNVDIGPVNRIGVTSAVTPTLCERWWLVKNVGERYIPFVSAFLAAPGFEAQRTPSDRDKTVSPQPARRQERPPFPTGSAGVRFSGLTLSAASS